MKKLIAALMLTALCAGLSAQAHQEDDGTVIKPREVLKEFGVTLPEDKEVRVWDSTAEVRYLVIPERPEGTGSLSEDQLAALVTRDSMIGTGLAKVPA
mgnify:CR=1 FL=1